MKIVCPACDAAYDVPASVLAAPRKMRCARCGHDWVPSAEIVHPHHEPPIAPAPIEQVATHDPVPAAEPPPEPQPKPAPPPEPESEPEPELVPVAHPALSGIDLVTPPPKPPLEDLVFTPASFTSFETLPPVVDPLTDDGFEPVPVRLAAMPPPVEPVLKPVPPRAPGDVDQIFADPALSARWEPGALLLRTLWAISILFWVSVGVAGFTLREPIMKNWPPSIRLYDSLGLAPAGG